MIDWKKKERMNYAILDGNSFLYVACHPNKVLDENGEPVKVNGKFTYTEKSLDDVKYNLNNILLSIFTKLDIGFYLGFLDGKNNFRKQINPLYKSNRKDFIPPKWIDEARNFLISDYNFKRFDCAEADDLCLIHAKHFSDRNIILVSNDKDILHTGVAYNWKTDTIIANSEEDTNRYLAIQLLQGDVADGVIGCKNIGKVKAERILNEVQDSNYLPRVLQEYIRIYGLYEGVVQFNLTFHSLYIRKELKELPCDGIEIQEWCEVTGIQ
jgi:5'-3' exonuclease